MSEWQDISTYNLTEGNLILLHTTYGDICLSILSDGIWWTTEGQSVEPTHWMPLPEPPHDT